MPLRGVDDKTVSGAVEKARKAGASDGESLLKKMEENGDAEAAEALRSTSADAVDAVAKGARIPRDIRD